MSRLVLLLALPLAVPALGGCSGAQSWGKARSPEVPLIRRGATTKRSIVRAFGPPDGTLRVEGLETWVWRDWEGTSVLGVWSEATRRDLFISFDGRDTVTAFHVTETGRGFSILSPLLPVSPVETGRSHPLAGPLEELPALAPARPTALPGDDRASAPSPDDQDEPSPPADED